MSEDKLNKMFEKISEMSERLTRIETIISERNTQEILEHHEQRLKALESHKDNFVGAKDVVTWLALAGIGVWEVLSK